MPLLTCTQCGLVGRWPTGQRFCSPRCATLAQRRPARDCPVCGISFHPPNTRQRYCCVACFGAARARPDRNCETCGTRFHPKSRAGRFCSPSCVHAPRRPAIVKRCLGCQQPFQVTHYRTEQQYCTKACRVHERTVRGRLARQVFALFPQWLRRSGRVGGRRGAATALSEDLGFSLSYLAHCRTGRVLPDPTVLWVLLRLYERCGLWPVAEEMAS